MRDGLQIEDAGIPIERKVALLDALSKTGLKRIVVGSFVSPKYTPQMARVDELMAQFHPEPGVTYLALALNQKGVERARKWVPPLTIESGRPLLYCHMCDVFIRRNNQSLADARDVAVARDHRACTSRRRARGGHRTQCHVRLELRRATSRSTWR